MELVVFVTAEQETNTVHNHLTQSLKPPADLPPNAFKRALSHWLNIAAGGQGQTPAHRTNEQAEAGRGHCGRAALRGHPARPRDEQGEEGEEEGTSQKGRRGAPG